MQHLAAVEAGVEHADADRDRREGLGLEPADEGVGVGHVGGEHLGVAALVLRMQLVQVPRCSGEHVVHHVDQEACGAGGEVVDGVAEFEATISAMLVAGVIRDSVLEPFHISIRQVVLFRSAAARYLAVPEHLASFLVGLEGVQGNWFALFNQAVQQS